MKKSLIMLICAAGFALAIAGCGGGGGTSDRGEVQQSDFTQMVNKAIEEQGADWVAEDNEISDLSDQEKASLNGASAIDETEAVNRVRVSLRSTAAAAGLPASFSWNFKDNQDWMSPVKNQGNCGSCTAHASLAVVEGLKNITAGNPALDVDLSESDLFSCSKQKCANGASLNAIADYIKNTGVSDEACLPYQAVDNVCPRRCANFATRLTKITSWNWIEDDAVSIKTAINQGPVWAAIDVYSDFFVYKTGVYQHVTGAYGGGHAIAIVGYDDGGGYWIVKNSWGPNWGDKGYIKIKYGQVGIEKWVMAMQYKEGTPVPPGVVVSATPMEAPFTTGGVKVAISCQTTGAISKLEVNCNKDGTYTAIPTGKATCTYPAAGSYTPSCRVNGTITATLSNPVVITAAVATSVTAKVSAVKGTVGDKFTLTCTPVGGSAAKLETRCHTNNPWTVLTKGNTIDCIYTKVGSYTPGCRANGNDKVVGNAPAPVVVAGEITVKVAVTPTTGKVADKYTVACTPSATAKTLERQCTNTAPWEVLSSTLKPCQYAKAGTYSPGCRVNSAKTANTTITVK